MRKIGYSILAFTALLAAAACSGEPETTTLDTSAPVLSVSSPTNGQIVGEAYQLTGTASDDSGSVEVSVKLDGGDWTAATVTGNNWSANVTSGTDGKHTNFVYAKDAAGNVSETVTVVVDRQSVPSVAIDTPANGYFSVSMNAHIAGTASIDSPYAVTNVEYSTGGSVWLSASGTNDWSFDAVLDRYTNEIKVRVSADNGSVAESSVWTIYCEYPYGTVVFASESGSDAYDGLTPSEPKLTVAGAVAAAQECRYRERPCERRFYPDFGHSRVGRLFASNQRKEYRRRLERRVRFDGRYVGIGRRRSLRAPIVHD